MSTPGRSPRASWPVRIAFGLLVATLVMLLVSVTLSTWRQIFPRPPVPTYVCVYVTEQGSTTVTGSTPCRAS